MSASKSGVFKSAGMRSAFSTGRIPVPRFRDDWNVVSAAM